MPLFAAAVGVALLAIAAAGCGGGSGSSSKTPALSAAEWRREADALCRRIGREVREVRPARTEGETSAFVAAVAPLWKRQLDSTSALEPPDEIAATVAVYIGALDYLNRQLVELQIAAERQESSRRHNAAIEIQGAARDVKLAAGALRLPACAKQRIP